MKRLRTVAVATLVSLLSVVWMGTASADSGSSLSVVSVSDRDVELVMALNPLMKVQQGAATKGTVEVQGVVVPAETTLEVPDTRQAVAIIVLDSSHSMTGARMKDARAAVKAFTKAVPKEVDIGLVTFSDKPDVKVLPTFDRNLVTDEVDATRPGGFTALYDGIDAALKAVPENTKARLVVLTDGQDTVSNVDLATVEAGAVASGVPVDVVALKPNEMQAAILQSLADSTGGTLRAAATSSEFVTAFQQASTNFGARVTLKATLPDNVDASGKPITATVSVAGDIVAGTTTLPDEASLSAPAPASVAPGTSSDAGPATPVALGTVSQDSVLPTLLGILVFVCILIATVMWVVFKRHERNVQRVEQVLSYQTGSQYDSARLARQLENQPSRLAGLDAFLTRHTNTKKMRSKLGAAEFNTTPAGWLVLRCVAAIALSALLVLIFHSWLIGFISGIVLTWLVARTILSMRSSRRQKAFGNELPDFLMLIASGLRAGLSFTHSMASAADDGKGEVGRQIRRVLREVQVGANLDDALIECANRMDNDDLRWTVTAMSIQREVGGNLSTILDSAAATIKSRDELRREVRTLSAEGRLSAYVLMALPLGMILFLSIFRGEYISLLWTDPLGIAMLVVLAILFIIGWFWMRAVIRIKV